MRSPYPLQWPPTWKRTVARAHPKFSSQFSQDRDSVIWQLKKRGGSQIVITSDLPVRRDGLPYASTGCDDPGIAVWWVHRGREHVIACDRWHRIGDNLRAIDKSLEAMRGLDRWGAAEVVEQAFAGFAALPAAAGDGAPPTPVKRTWREVLGVPVDGWAATAPAAAVLAYAKSQHREMILKHHPDRNGGEGDLSLAVELGEALAAARAELEAEAAP